jgi:sulfite reductase alpha subunit-like flavoprotein
MKLLVDDGAACYICGSVKMAKEVKEAFVGILKDD